MVDNPLPKSIYSPKRNKPQRERDLVDIAEMYVKGMSQWQITREFANMRPYTISRSQIQRDIMLIQKRWRDSYLVAVDDHMVKELARIDRLEQEYWTEWAESKKDKSEVRTEKVTDKTGTKSGQPFTSFSRDKVIAKKVKRDGNVAYLDGVRWCIEQRCKILGLNAPSKVEIDWKDEARKAGVVDPEALEDELVAQFIAAASQGANE